MYMYQGLGQMLTIAYNTTKGVQRPQKVLT